MLTTFYNNILFWFVDEDESDTEEEIENVTEEQTVSGELGASNGHVEVKS